MPAYADVRPNDAEGRTRIWTIWFLPYDRFERFALSGRECVRRSRATMTARDTTPTDRIDPDTDPTEPSPSTGWRETTIICGAELPAFLDNDARPEDLL